MRNRASTSLAKAKIRQSWSKYNLYNMQRFRNPGTVNRTFFQQKWTAKALSRAYHGEQVREGQWKRMFSKRIRSVIPMNTNDLAADDGSKASAGRGSGLEKAEKGITKRLTPYTQMAFAPLERRLDVAIFRSLFASSTRQARQFVIHGAVTVNGHKMRHPSYLLNPGDLFQVDPERVMFATGAPKTKFERRETRQLKQKAEETEAETEEAKEAVEQEDKAENTKDTLKALMAQAKNIMSKDKDVLPAKRKQELRGFQKAVRRVLSRSETSTVLTDNLETQFSELTLLLKAKRAEKAPKESKKDKKGSTEEKAVVEESEGASDALSEAFKSAAQGGEVDTSELSDEEFDVLKRALTQMRDNPIDNSKTYATPWRPRDFMSAFAFIPRYLEVNQNICAAVYLRHPVARPGSAEVPTPFGEAVSTPAYGWYLKRRW
ncbi:uncharacterized protein N7443_009164 [Penicillium atrosanguineum]|uniref:Small ribosomal subunit protein uS4m n=1 Tax=Penicillium atrosanguineum TaxID=1132637 RepID=A0A9W9PPW4_9EURO|nr:uncharacterized protein N7443_009164 [Penicillium atrosanguineum]KAJ5293211.1 hypothetical protein N7443_009164 [Penicillium atrosanguineum]KAJ5302753.1 hypothetical protein N7476_009552 [Penicillium atrosanguineum]